MNIPAKTEVDENFTTKRNEQFVVGQGYSSNKHKEDEGDEIDLRELLGVLLRRKGTILLIAILIFIAAFLITMMTTPIYRAKTTLQVDMDQSNVLGYDIDADGAKTNSYSDEFYETQFQILKSRALATRTVDSMGLAQKTTSKVPKKTFFTEMISSAKELAFGNAEDKVAVFQEEVDSSKVWEGRLMANLNVSQIKYSQILDLSYDSSDPELAANIVNAVAENYIAMNLDRRVDSASFAKNFLTEQLIDVKSRLEESEANLIRYAKDKGIYQTGDETSPSLIALRVNDLSSALSKAQSDRITKQNHYREAQKSEGASKVLESTTVQELKQNLIKLQGTYQEKLQVYKPGYPLMVQMKRQMNEYITQIELEVRTIKSTVEGALRADYLTAKSNEDALLSELEKQKLLLTEMRDKSIGYNTLLREVETSRSSYEGLLTRLKEVSVAGGVQSNNISVLDSAVKPLGAFKPNKPRNLAIGTVLGLFFGVIVAFLLEFFDDRVKSTEEASRILGLPLLGTTPALKGTDPVEHALTTAREPTSATAEAFRSLRTNLLFASREGIPKVLALTSALPSEGKSSSCLNLATAFVQSNKRVLLVDADLRKPTVHKRLKLDNSLGLSSFLTGQSQTDATIQETSIQGLHAMTAGPLSPNPAELLSSDRLQELFDLVPDAFDLIILDCPPVIGLADALILANRASATVVVSAYSQSRKRALQDTNRRLLQAQANLIGFIFTKVKSGIGYGNDYNYEYYYSYGAESLPKQNG